MIITFAAACLLLMAVDDDDDHEADLVMSNQAVTLDNFFAGRHFSVPDHMEKALARWSEGAELRP